MTLRWTAFLAMLLLVAAAPDALAQRYTLDTDPLRLGNKALESGALAEARSRFEEAIAAGHEVAQARYGLAQVTVREGRFADAEPLYRLALEAKGGDYPEAQAGLGLLLLRFGRDLEAKQEFEAALQRDSKCWPAQYGMARLELATKKWGDAKKRLDRGSDERGVAEGEDLFHHGMALYHLGRNEMAEAETEALRALHLNPADPSYGTLVGQIYEKRGSPTLAIDAFEKALAAPGVKPTAPTLHSLGQLYEQTRQFNQAQSRYLEAARTDSTYAPALKDLAHLYARAKEYDRSARFYLRYVQLKGDDLDALLELGNVCIEIDRYGQAVEAARAALKLEPGSSQAKHMLARAGIRSSDPKLRAEAAKMFRESGSSGDWNSADLVALGSHFVKERQLDAARDVLNRALAQDASLAPAHYQLGLAAMHAGDPVTAMAELRKAADLDPGQPIYHLNLGIAALQAKQTAQAVPAFRKAVELKGDLLIARLFLAQSLAATDDIAGARAEYEKVVAAEPNNGKALRGLGYCYIRDADYQKAADRYLAATKANPEDAEAWAGLGNARLGLDQLDASEEAFRRAQSLDPQNVTAKSGMELLQQARSGG